jgi:hypothetical protein
MVGLHGTLNRLVNKTGMTGVAGAMTGIVFTFLEHVTNVLNYLTIAGVLSDWTGALSRLTNKNMLAGTQPASTGVVHRGTSLNGLAGAAGNFTGSIAKKIFLNGLSGVIAAGQWAGSVIVSFVTTLGGATFLGSGTLTITGLDMAPIVGGRLYIVVYDSLGNTLGSGPIYQIQSLSITKRLDQSGSFTFQIPAADDRAALITQGVEIRVFREGEGEIYRGKVEKSDWGVRD